MSTRERWLAAMRMEPLDRLPFWPKIGGPYLAAQRVPWRERTVQDVHEFIGSELHVHVPFCVRVDHGECSFEVKREGCTERGTYHTPAGKLTTTSKWDDASGAWHPIEFPVKTPEDIDVLRTFYEHGRAEFAPDQHEKAAAIVREKGHSNMIVSSIAVSPLMDWIEHRAGVEMGHYLIADEPERVDALFDAVHRLVLRTAEIVTENCPCDAVYSSENTSTTLISPAMFRRYSMRYLRDYGEALQAAGKMHILHQCGYIKDLLPDMAKLPARATEAFTSPPVGNTRFIDGRNACGGLCLIGGTNATLWLSSADRIIAELERDLDALPHTRGLVVSSAGVMPPFASPETIKQVCDWVNAYPVRN